MIRRSIQIMRAGLLFIALACSAQEFPASVRVDPSRITLHTGSGSLASQLVQLRKNGDLVKLRAYVAGDASDVIRVIQKSIPRKMRPVLEVVPVAALPHGSQVMLSSLSTSKKIQNPNGLLFISGQLSTAPLAESGTPLLPLAQKTMASLNAIVKDSIMLQVSCYTSSLVDEHAIHMLISGTFPQAAISIVQTESAPAAQGVECDGIARLNRESTQPAQLTNPTQAAFAQSVAVSAPALLSATQWSPDVKTAFGDLRIALEEGGSSLAQVVYAYAYPSNAALLQQYRDTRWDYFARSKAPASTNLVFSEGQGRIGIGVIAMPR